MRYAITDESEGERILKIFAEIMGKNQVSVSFLNTVYFLTPMTHRQWLRRFVATYGIRVSQVDPYTLRQ